MLKSVKKKKQMGFFIGQYNKLFLFKYVVIFHLQLALKIELSVNKMYCKMKQK